MDITLTNGAPAQVRIVHPGAPYGRSAVNDKGRTLIEFNIGWMCAQYRTGTILTGGYSGLCLDCGQAKDTTISMETMMGVREWIMENI